MSSNDHDRPDTMAAPPPSPDDIETSPRASEAPLARRSTLPPNPVAEAGATAALKTMLPADPGIPSTIRELAIDDLIAMHRRVDAGLNELLGDDGRLARQTAAIAQTIDRAAARWDGTYRLLSGEVRAFREEQTKKDSEQDRQIAELQKRVERLTGELSEMNTAITELAMRGEISENRSSPIAGRVVLVVEDSQALARTLSRHIRARGAEAVIAHTRAEAEDAMAHHTPDVALVDIRLGLDDGMAVADWLLRRGMPSSRVILMTGQIAEAAGADALAAGLRVLRKPFPALVMIGAIQDALVAAPPATPP